MDLNNENINIDNRNEKCPGERAVIDYSLLYEQADDAIQRAETGLPSEVFSFVSSLTPMVNVDLLVIKNGKALLAWRDDGRNLGWHIPGGIVRFKETFEERLQKTAMAELGCMVQYDPEPVKISEIRMWYQRRGHFISFLYKCTLPDDYEIDNHGLSETDDGYLKWFEHEPEDLVEGQACYKGIIEGIISADRDI